MFVIHKLLAFPSLQPTKNTLTQHCKESTPQSQFLSLSNTKDKSKPFLSPSPLLNSTLGRLKVWLNSTLGSWIFEPVCHRRNNVWMREKKKFYLLNSKIWTTEWHWTLFTNWSLPIPLALSLPIFLLNLPFLKCPPSSSHDLNSTQTWDSAQILTAQSSSLSISHTL